MRALKRDVPVLLERDFDIPELSVLQDEIDVLRKIKKKALKKSKNVAIQN